MSMLSYKQYKLLQENFDGVIGIKSPTNLGAYNEAPQLAALMKKMNGDGPPMGKPGMKNAEDDMDDADADMDDAEGDMDDADMDDAEGDMDDADADMGDADADMGLGADAGMGGPSGPPMGGPGMGGPPMMGKPGKKPPMMMNKMGAMYMKKEAAADSQDAKMKGQNKKNKANDQDIDKPGTAQKKTTFVREGCCEKCEKCKKSKKMTKEQQEFNDSLRRQTGIGGTGALKFQQDELGFWVPVTEDVLIQPNKEPEQNSQPNPGEVGYAPQQKLGSNFQEWASYHTKQAKRNKK